MMLPEVLTLESIRAAQGAGATPLDIIEEVIARFYDLHDLHDTKR